jgi:hypothetical protein
MTGILPVCGVGAFDRRIDVGRADHAAALIELLA